jgi:DNA replication and repair protein RecF
MLKTYLEPWDIQLAETGSAIIFKRAEVLEKFKDYLAIQYQSITGLNLKPSLKYESICDEYESFEQIHEEYKNQIESNFEKEAEREQTIIGPHRDEVVFFLGNIELRNYGSQGQHRLFSMALKMAQLFYYSDELDDLPIMLLDDVFGNLDQQKIDVITEALTKHSGQTFITSASERPFDKKMFDGIEQNAWFMVENGTVSRKF